MKKLKAGRDVGRLVLIVAYILGIREVTGQGPVDCTQRPAFTDGQAPAQSIVTPDQPFQLVVSSSSYQPGQTVTVTINSSGGNASFATVRLTARLVSNHSVVGTFSPAAGASLSCSNSFLINADSSNKTELTAMWNSPLTAAGLGPIYFLATIWQDDVMTWLNVTSSTLSYVTVTTAAPSVTSPGPEIIDVSGCGNTKGCFRSPESCAPASACNWLLTWTNDDAANAVRFEMTAPVDAADWWIAFGLSKDQQMGMDSVISCSYSALANRVEIAASWNVGNPRGNLPLSNTQLGIVQSGQSTNFVNNRIYCSFLRLKTVSDAEDRVYPINAGQMYYILMARGELNTQGVKQQHRVTISSNSEVDLTKTQQSGGDANAAKLRRDLTKAHGILMVLAWCIFANAGILMPRYYKPTWANKKWCGKAVWFQIHQPCMIICLLLTTTAFIIIFCAVRDYSYLPSPGVAHPPLGICVMALVIINPVMAICRPHPDAKRRYIFNTAHFFVGFLAHVTSAITVFLGLWQYGLPDWCMGVMGALVGFHILIEIILFIYKNAHKCCRHRQSRDITVEQEFRMSSLNDVPVPKEERPTSYTGHMFKTVVMFVHLFGVMALAIILAAKIGLHDGPQRTSTDVLSMLP